MFKVEFTKAKNNHIEQIHEIEKISFITPWSYESIEQDVLHHDIAKYYVATIDVKVVGYIGFWYVEDEAHIVTFAISEDFRKLGIGKELLEFGIREMKKLDITGFTLEVRESNMAAYNLYNKCNFIKKGIRKKYYSDTNEDAIIMWRYEKQES